MRTSFITAALLPLAALASPIVVERDVNSITSSIATIVTKLTTLNNTLNTFSKNSPTGLLTALRIQSQTDNLGKAVQSATSAASASAPLNDDDSLTVGLAVLNLQPQISSVLDNIVAHKAAFNTVIFGIGGVGPLVESDLKNQKTYANQFGTALVPKLSSTYQGLAPPVIAQISAAFDQAIAAFANTKYVGSS